MGKGKDKDLKSLDQIKQEADPDIEIHSLRRQLDRAKSEIRKMQADYGDLRGYFRDIDIIAKDFVLPLLPLEYKHQPGKTVKSPCVAVLHFSDWHYGAVQEPSEIEGFNAFSPEIAEKRIENLIEDFLKWVDVLRSGYLIENCVVLDTGDMISGDIHRELSITNAFPSPVQAFKCGVFKGRIIASLSPHFKELRIEYITPDNHGRLTKVPQAKQAGLNTHNYVVGHVAKLISSDQTNIEFNIHTSHNKSVEVAGRHYLLTHGHDVMGWMGLPYYGIERKVSKEALSRMWEPDYNKFHRCIMGHWHAPATLPWYWIGGSVSGTDAYDHKQGRRSDPIQCAWINHPKKGEFNRTEFRLRDN